MTANQITTQDIAEMAFEAAAFTTNAKFSATRIFRDFCGAFEIEPTKRQASKFRRNTGQLFAAVADRLYRRK